MAKAEPVPAPDLIEVNRLIRTELGPGTVSKTIDVEHALAVLRAENTQLRERVSANAQTVAQNAETHRKSYEGWRRENLRLQNELLASQERVFELQDKLLSLRQIINGTTTKEQASCQQS